MKGFARVVGVGLVAAVLGSGVTACDPTPTCGVTPKKPEQIRTPTFFGRVARDPQKWTVRPSTSERATLTVGNRTFKTDPRTERLGYCGPPFNPVRCTAFVGLGSAGTADWVLLAEPVSARDAYAKGRMQISNVIVWKVHSESLVLSEGVELPFGKTFHDKLEQSDNTRYPLRSSLQGRQVATSLYIDPRVGEVVDVGLAGCM